MDYLSKLGYSEGSPFKSNAANTINSNLITMRNTRQPLVAVSKTGAGLMVPGRQYNTAATGRRKYQEGGTGGTGGSTTEIPMETLLALEPMLLAAHLNTLSKKDKELFMAKYTPLPDNMRRAALIQMIGKYPDVLEDMQEGEIEGQESEGTDQEEQYMQGGGSSKSKSRDRFREKLYDVPMPMVYQDGGQISYKEVKGAGKEKLKAIQMDLKAKGLYKGRIDGIYGPLTEAAVEGYNAKNNSQSPPVSKAAQASKYQPTTSEARKGNTTATRRPSEAELQAELDATGTNSERTDQMLPGFINKRLYNNFLPAGYRSPNYENPATRFFDAAVVNNPDPSITNTRTETGEIHKEWKNRYDAWAMYLGQPQRDKSFKLSQYKPSVNGGDGYYYDFNNISDSQRQAMLKEYLRYNDNGKTLAVDDGDDTPGAMGTYTLSGGKDTKGTYVSYYDKWDLAGSNGVGKPFDIYGRIYYDPKTAKVKKQSGGALPDAFEDSPWTLVGSAPTPKNMTPASQGSAKSPSKSSVKAPGAKKSVKLQDDYTAEDEAFWEAQRKINKIRTDAENAKNYNRDSPVIDPTIRSLRSPAWLQNSRPAYSNTTATIANISGDPLYKSLSGRRYTATDNQRSYTPEPYQKLMTEDALRRMPINTMNANSYYPR